MGDYKHFSDVYKIGISDVVCVYDSRHRNAEFLCNPPKRVARYNFYVTLLNVNIISIVLS